MGSKIYIFELAQFLSLIVLLQMSTTRPAVGYNIKKLHLYLPISLPTLLGLDWANSKLSSSPIYNSRTNNIIKF